VGKRGSHRGRRSVIPETTAATSKGSDEDCWSTDSTARTMVDSSRFPMTMTNSAGTIDPALRP